MSNQAQDLQQRFAIGQRVRIVDRGKTWRAGEIEMYGGRYGSVQHLHLDYDSAFPISVQLEDGPCAGESRWFALTEIAEYDADATN